MAERISDIRRPPARVPWVLRATGELSTEAVAWFQNLLSPWEVADFCTSGRSSKRGFLICRGETIGAEGSGADYEGSYLADLFAEVRDWSPNAGTESFSGLDTVTLPDFRGAMFKGRASDAVGDTGGSVTHDHSVPALSVAAHTHPLSENGWVRMSIRTAGIYFKLLTQTISYDREKATTEVINTTSGTQTTSVGLEGATDSGGSGSTGTGTTGSASSYPPYVTVNVFVKW